MASKKKPHDSARSANATDARGTKENPLVVDTLGHQQTPIERQEAKKQAAKAEAEEDYHRVVDRWMLRWTGTAAIATAFLVLVGIGGTIAAIWTLRQIKRQADLMAVPYKQSVMFTNWESEFYQAPPDQTPAIRIGFSLMSAIQFPLTIHYGEIIFMPRTSRAPYIIQDIFLPPNTPHSGDVCLSLNDHTQLVIKHGPVAFSFEGHFIHTGPLGERIKQQFAGDVICREGHEARCEFPLHASQKDRADQTRMG